MCRQFIVALNSTVSNIDIPPPSLLKLCKALEEKSSIIQLAEAIRNSFKPLARGSLLAEQVRLNKLVEELTIEHNSVQSVRARVRSTVKWRSCLLCLFYSFNNSSFLMSSLVHIYPSNVRFSIELYLAQENLSDCERLCTIGE